MVRHWAGSSIRVRRETGPGAVARVGLGRGCKRNSVLLFT